MDQRKRWLGEGQSNLKISVVGNACGGKTILSRRLSELYKIPLTHVDGIQFLPGQKLRPYPECIEILNQVQQQEDWIIDGYGPLDIIEKRFQMADKVIFIDLPLWRHYWWCTKRQVKNLWSRRKELPSDYKEFSWQHNLRLYRGIGSAHRQMRPELLRIFSRPGLKEKVIHVQSVASLQKLFHEGF